MKKIEFTTALRELLKELPQKDIDGYIEYYSEMIDDRMEDGLDEAAAVGAVGSPAALAEEILVDHKVEKWPKLRVPQGWEWALIILGFPLWGSLLLTLLVVTLTVYASLWSIVILAFAAVPLCIFGAVLLLANIITGSMGGTELVLFYTGTAIGALGLAIFMFFAAKWLYKVVLKNTKIGYRQIKKYTARRKEAA